MKSYNKTVVRFSILLMHCLHIKSHHKFPKENTDCQNLLLDPHIKVVYDEFVYTPRTHPAYEEIVYPAQEHIAKGELLYITHIDTVYW